MQKLLDWLLGRRAPDTGLSEGEIEGVLRALVKVTAPKPEPVAVLHTVTNVTPGLTVHLGNQRRLRFGESAQVSAEIANDLRAKGLVE